MPRTVRELVRVREGVALAGRPLLRQGTSISTSITSSITKPRQRGIVIDLEIVIEIVAQDGRQGAGVTS
jgi:hypothetical protein